MKKTAHAHGCLRLILDPGIADLAETVLRGRISHYELDLRGQLPPGHGFSAESLEFDILSEKPTDDESVPETLPQLNPEAIVEHLHAIRKGKEAEPVVTQFHDWLLATIHPSPPSDADKEKRDPSTVFDFRENVAHPSNCDPRTVVDLDPSEREENYCQLCNAVQRHSCNDYCLGKRKRTGAEAADANNRANEGGQQSSAQRSRRK